MNLAFRSAASPGTFLTRVEIIFLSFLSTLLNISTSNMASSNAVVSIGPLKMYKLKPYQIVDVIELPSIMYKLPSYYSTTVHKVCDFFRSRKSS